MRQDMFFQTEYRTYVSHVETRILTESMNNSLCPPKKLRSLLRCGLGPCLESKKSPHMDPVHHQSRASYPIPKRTPSRCIFVPCHHFYSRHRCCQFCIASSDSSSDWTSHHGRSVSKTCSQVVEPPMWKIVQKLIAYCSQIESSPQVNLDITNVNQTITRIYKQG